ncbi:hypothetical protein MHYP_G00073200 [Metynnis hypsauchen]
MLKDIKGSSWSFCACIDFARVNEIRTCARRFARAHVIPNNSARFRSEPTLPALVLSASAKAQRHALRTSLPSARAVTSRSDRGLCAVSSGGPRGCWRENSGSFPVAGKGRKAVRTVWSTACFQSSDPSESSDPSAGLHWTPLA